MCLGSNIDGKIIYYAQHNLYDGALTAAIFTDNGANADLGIEKIIGKFIIRVANRILCVGI